MTATQIVNDVMQRAVDIINEEILQSLTRLGEESVARIRTRSMAESWIDHTGNLRSSIGYAVFEHGRKVIGSSFDAVAGPEGNGTAGSKAGEKYLETLASQYAKTYALVVVAGMDYAGYVEAIEGKDVLASTEIWAKDKVDRYLSDAKERADVRINAIIHQYV